jgi:hypothetical protein
LAAAVTVSVDAPLIPFIAAVIVDEPAATAVAMPLAAMVATGAEELVQVTDELTSPVVPSL